jgi:hypothetical protein
VFGVKSPPLTGFTALLRLAAMLARPDSATPGTMAGLSEPRRSSGAWSAHNRAVGRG